MSMLLRHRGQVTTCPSNRGFSGCLRLCLRRTVAAGRFTLNEVTSSAVVLRGEAVPDEGVTKGKHDQAPDEYKRPLRAGFSTNSNPHGSRQKVKSASADRPQKLDSAGLDGHRICHGMHYASDDESDSKHDDDALAQR